jgi:diguanylate cyclase (GGDEF)-like protein/PAS domain S-box-containing protein
MLKQSGVEHARLVLIVDDSSSTRIMMREVLKAEGFLIEEAADGLMAMEVYHRCHPDIVLLDIEMPYKDGFEVCAEIRSCHGGDRVPIVMTTGADDVNAIQHAYEVGASDFISKPISWAVLAYQLRYILRASDAIEEQRKAVLMISGMAKVIENTSNEIYILENKTFKFQDINHSARDNIGYATDELFGLTIYDLLPHTSPAAFLEYIEPLLNGACKQVELELDIKRKNNTTYLAQLHIHTFVHEDSISVVLIGEDISNRKQAEKRMRHLAYFDALTGLPNRRQFTEELEMKLQLENRSSQQLALLFIDMDNFKRINDTLGHSIGDLLLCEVSTRLMESVRVGDQVLRQSSREANISVSRLGGDEFTVLISNMCHRNDVEVVANRILTALRKPMTLNGHELIVTPSIGISQAPMDGKSVELLLKHADTAMYQAKKAGCNNYQFYDIGMDHTSFERLNLESELYKAMELDQIEVHYQPIVDLRSGAVLEVEALVRWRHPSRGLIFPDAFISIAEEIGAIAQLGEIVLRKACRQLREWQLANMTIQRVAVNISSMQIRQKNFLPMVAEILKETGLAPNALILELTESILMLDAEQNIDTLQKLKKTGIFIALDDFGTGYSSLSYLQRFPVDILKIDRSFINDIRDKHNNAGIINAVAALARSLNLQVVCEGIETMEQLRFLCDLNVDTVQGYLLSKALPAIELVKGLQSGTFSTPVMLCTEAYEQTVKSGLVA